MDKKSTVRNRAPAKETQRQIYSELFPQKPSKSDKRRLDILEGAIRAYSSVSYEHVSFDDVAGPAGTSRRLVKHYFPDKDGLFETTMKFIRGQYQAFVVEAFAASEDPQIQFDEYVRSAVGWAHALPNHAKAWFLYFLVSSQQKRYRALHEELAGMGASRIQKLILAMAPAGAAPPTTSEEDLHYAAKTIQRIITGAVIELCAEHIAPDAQRIEKEAVRACRYIAMGALSTIR